MNFSPIVIFTYNRPSHLNELFKTLEKNDESKKSDVFIYIDRYENEIDKDANEQVLKISDKNWKFKSKKIIYRDEHIGLKANILTGISEILENFEKIIVLEDDLLVSPYFLKFMNESLEKYKNNKEVWHVSGYSMDTLLNDKRSTYFTSEMNCWGWGTWQDRWINIQDNLINKVSQLSPKEVKNFNFYGKNKNNLNQLLLNEEKKISTWAIFWYQTIFLNGGLCLNPSKSFVQNNGFDGKGANKSSSNFYRIDNLNICDNYNFPSVIKRNKVREKLVVYRYMKKNLKDYFRYHLNKLIKV